jgi:hypothetical protein
VTAAVAARLSPEAGEEQLTDEVIGQVVSVVRPVRPVRPDGHGQGWAELEARRDQIAGWVECGVPVVKIGVLLARQGVVVAERTLHRFAAGRCGAGSKVTTRVDDGPPGRVRICPGAAGPCCSAPDTQSGRCASVPRRGSARGRGFRGARCRQGARRSRSCAEPGPRCAHAARRRIDARGTQDLSHRGRRDRYAEHSQAEYPANQQADDLEQHAASQPSRRAGSGEGTGQPRNRLFERHRLPTGALLTGARTPGAGAGLLRRLHPG